MRRLTGQFGPICGEKDRAEAIDLAGRSFSVYEDMVRHLGRAAFAPGLYDPEFVRIARADGKIVSVVMMTPRTLRLGSVRIPAVTMGPICTDVRYRKRGYASGAIKDAVRFLRDRGIPLAYLGGIPEFYQRFGFYPYRWSYVAKVSVTDGLKRGGAGRVRTLAVGDWRLAARAYQAATASCLCTVDRGAEVWQWLLRLARRESFWLFTHPHAILDARGRFIGYFTTWRAAGESLCCPEMIVRPEAASCAAALGAVARFARSTEKSSLEFWIAPDQPLAQYLTAHVPVEMRLTAQPTGGPLMRVISFVKLLTALAPVFEERVRASEFQRRRLAFTLRSGAEAVGIVWRGGELTVGPRLTGAVANVPPRYFPGVLTGFYDAGAVERFRGARIPQQLRRPLQVLFPRGFPIVLRGDDM